RLLVRERPWERRLEPSEERPARHSEPSLWAGSARVPEQAPGQVSSTPQTGRRPPEVSAIACFKGVREGPTKAAAVLALAQRPQPAHARTGLPTPWRGPSSGAATKTL